MTQPTRDPSLLASVLPADSPYLKQVLDIEAIFGIDGSFPARLNLLQALLELLVELPQSSKTESWKAALQEIAQQEKTSAWEKAAPRREFNPLYRQYGQFPLAACLLQEAGQERLGQAKGIKLLLLSVILEGSFPVEKLADHASVLRKSMHQGRQEAKLVDLPEFTDTFDAYVAKLKNNLEDGLLKGDMGKSVQVLLGGIKVRRTDGPTATGGQPIHPFLPPKPPKKPVGTESVTPGPYAPPINVKRIRIGGQREPIEAEPPAFISLVSSPPLHLPAEPDDEIARRLDEEQADAQLRISKQWMRRHDKLAPTDYGRFTPLERAQLAQAIKADLTSKSPQSLAAGLIGCIYFTGMPLETLLSTETSGEHAVFDPKGRYIKEARRPEGAFTPTEQQQRLLENTTSKITFELPNLIAEWLAETLAAGDATLGLCLGVTEDEARQKVKDWLEKLRETASMRIRIERIQAALSIELTLAHRDSALTWHTAGRENQAAPMLAYYVAYPEQHIVSAYNQTASFMWLEQLPIQKIEPSQRTGYYPTTAVKNVLISGLSQRIDEAMKSNSIAVRHNAFTDYCLALLFAATGHRPVTDPFYSSSLFSLEKGCILISDKTHIAERDWRLIALPELAREQLKLYENHLTRLPAWLEASGSHMLSTAVAQLCERSASPGLPLFFYLDEEVLPGKLKNITPSVLKQRWSELWSLPNNISRHMLAESLACDYRRSDYAQIQLGHFMGNEHPFGAAASFSAQEVLGQINQLIQEYLLKSGWQAKQLPIRLPKNSEATALEAHSALPAYEGPERFQKRQNKEQRQRNLIRQAIKQSLNNNKISSPSEITKIESYILDHGDPKEINQSLRVLYRYLWYLPGGKEHLSTHGNKRVFEVEASPYNDKSIHDYGQLTELRQRFLNRLDALYKKESAPSIAESIAEIIISIAIFGGIADPQKLKAIPEALLRNTYKHLEKLFIEIPLRDKEDEPDESAPIFRWFPDAVTHLLIGGFFVRHSKLISKVSLDELRIDLDKALPDIMQELALNATAKKAYQIISKIVLPAITFEAPGHMYQFLCGESISVSIPHKQWIRFHSDHALALESLGQQEPLGATLNALEINLSEPADAEFSPRAFTREIRQIHTEVSSLEVPGNRLPSTFYKQELVKRIHNTLQGQANPWPINCQLIIAWLLHLCSYGTRQKKNLRYSTIQKYVNLVLRALLEARPETNFLDLDAADFESLYQDILERESDKLRPYVAGRLVEFHAFLEQAYACDPVEWSAIFGGADVKKQELFPDANMISEAEYLRIINLLSEHPGFNEQQRLQLVAMMVFGYRFGLRFGEAYKLLHRDIQVYEEQITIIVRCNLFADDKTSSSRRVVPQLENFSTLERETINKITLAAGVAAEKDSLAPIFFALQGERSLERKSLLSSVLGKVIRAATGDTSLRFHHLRHSWATRMYAYQFQKNGFGSSSLASTSINTAWWASLLGHHEAQIPLTSISVALGHSSEATTLCSYIHSMDLGACQLYNLEEYNFSNTAIAYALGGVSEAVVRQKKSRRSLYALHKNIPVQTINKAPPIKNLKSILNTSKDQKTTLIKIEHILLRLMVRQGDIYKVSDELLITPELIIKVLNEAVQQDKHSGFDYYNADAMARGIYPSKFLAIRQQDDDLHQFISKMQLSLDQMTSEKRETVKQALLVWARTLSGNRNIISNQQDQESLIWLAENLLSTTVELTKERTSAQKIRMVEKTQLRRSTANTFKINKTEHLKTDQAISRFLFVLLVYMQLESH